MIDTVKMSISKNRKKKWNLDAHFFVIFDLQKTQSNAFIFFRYSFTFLNYSHYEYECHTVCLVIPFIISKWHHQPKQRVRQTQRVCQTQRVVALNQWMSHSKKHVYALPSRMHRVHRGTKLYGCRRFDRCWTIVFMVWTRISVRPKTNTLNWRIICTERNVG